jgi:hypothetical protein
VDPIPRNENVINSTLWLLLLMLEIFGDGKFLFPIFLSEEVIFMKFRGH